MSFDTLGDLNWLAVLVAGIAYFLLGAIWYAPPVLGRPWMRAAGMEMPAEGQRPGPEIYIAPLVTCLIAAVATGMLALATVTSTLSEGIVLGVVVGIGYAVTVLATTAIFETKKPQPGVWFLITAGYHLVGLVIVAVIVALWD